MTLSYYKYSIVLLMVVFILMACSANSTPAPRGAIVPTRQATALPTATVTASATPTATFTLTPSSTPTPQPTSLPTNTPTPTVPSVTIGEELSFTINGTITSTDWRVQYIFDGNAGDSISVEMNTDSAQLDPLLIILDETGTRLAENDDIDIDTDNAGILNYVLLVDGAYTVLATRRGEEDSPYIGDYQLSFLRLPANYYDPMTGIFLMPIETNTDEIGIINDSDPFQSYIFSGNAGDVVTIEMNRASGNLDPYVILVNRSTQLVVAQNDDDDRSDTVNSHIESITLPDDGEYIILATRYQGVDGSSSGEFILRISTQQ